MNAYELFCQDLMGDELIRANTDRRAYYTTLRQTLREELAAGAACQLLEHYGKRLQAGAPAGMYLLDAAAIWECYEATVGGLRFPRDVGQGIPFQLSGDRRLSWSEVQRLSELRALPVAALDPELRARLEGLIKYARTPAGKRATLVVPAVNPRAKLQILEARSVTPIPAPGAVQKAAPAAHAPKDSRDKAQLEQLRQQVARLQQEKDALQQEKNALKAELARAEARPQTDVGEMMQVADLILHNRMAEAASQARRIGSELEGELLRLQELQDSMSALQEKLQATREQLTADTAQAEALRAQQRTAEQALENARRDCAQAQRDAADCLKEKQAADRSLTEARERLQTANAELRELQRRIARTNAAADLTRRQADRLS